MKAEQNYAQPEEEKRILIVDDEVQIASILSQKLTGEGYSCVTANEVQQVMDYFYKGNFWLVILDIRMPGMSGIDLLKEVKAVDPKLAVIMMTGYPEIDMAVDAMRLGAYDFLIKPVDLDLVVLSVRKALEKKRLEEEVEAYHKNLEKLVQERTSKLEESYRILKEAHLNSVKVLSEAIEVKDPCTRGHSNRVTRISLRIARHMGFSEDRLEILEYGALLHDIGKIGIKDEVLQKPGRLNSEEFKHIREHPLIGMKIVERIDFFRDKIPIIRNHHEHFDGSGYPDGLTEEVIPPEARIIAVADVFDAMTSLRPYRSAISPQEVLTEMETQKGKHFDPMILDIFIGEKIYRT